jgi:hypothetical protein
MEIFNFQEAMQCRLIQGVEFTIKFQTSKSVIQNGFEDQRVVVSFYF